MSPFINTYSEDRSHERAHNRERDIQMVNVIKKLCRVYMFYPSKNEVTAHMTHHT
jgi:hypothetical protein